MRQSTHRLTISTRGKGFYEITAEVGSWLSQQGLRTGLLTLFLQHTSASLVIQENADPDVVKDLETFFSRLVREDDSLYTHTVEGPDDMPAHIRAALTQTHLSVPILGGQPSLGTWQGIYVFEHRRRPHQRSVVLHALGE
jgi:secondary thiamine-phosphate synthase enzyme